MLERTYALWREYKAATGTKLLDRNGMLLVTPDEHFIIDRHPDDDRIIVAGGFS